MASAEPSNPTKSKQPDARPQTLAHEQVSRADYNQPEAPFPPVPRNGRCGVVVIGAGPAGLATAASLAKRAIDVVIFESAPDAGQSWRSHYERLHLHTTRALSGLPGAPIPRKLGQWVSATDYARYLEQYARQRKLRISTNTSVLDIKPDNGEWRVRTEHGTWHADQVVVATGLNRVPDLPAWPGRDSFTGALLHSSNYRNAEPYRGRDVLVVGAGNTGAEIACDLVESGAARVRLAIRTGPNILPRSVLGVPTQVTGVLFRRVPPIFMDPMVSLIRRLTLGDLTRFGVPRPPRGLFTQVLHHRSTPIIDVGLVKQLKAGRIEAVAAVQSFDKDAVCLADGTRITPDVVVAATGFRPDLQPMLGQAVLLGAGGLPGLSKSGEAVDAPGLYFIGYFVSLNGVLNEIGLQAKRIAQSISAKTKTRKI